MVTLWKILHEICRIEGPKMKMVYDTWFMTTSMCYVLFSDKSTWILQLIYSRDFIDDVFWLRVLINFCSAS